MKKLGVFASLTLVLVIVVIGLRSVLFGQGPVTITVDPGQRYQTIVGWEGVAVIGNDDYPDEFWRWQEEVNDRVVNELGINRLRLETHQEKDGIEAGNDNNDPFGINWSGFNFTQFDRKIEEVVLPVKQHIEGNGETLYVNFNTVAVANRNINPVHMDPEEFAEFVLAHFLHLDTKYGFVPDGVEVSLEPDVFNTFDQDPEKLALALVATGDRLKAHGYTPDFIAPSNTNMSNATSWFDGIIGVPRVKEYLTEISYHRYGRQSRSRVEAIAERGQEHGLRTAMLERIGAGYEELHEDLKVGNNSSWQQYTLAYPTGDNGAQYYNVTDINQGTVEMGSRTKYLRQYFKYVRSGAERIGASSSNGSYDPVAFINKDGKYVVVVKAGSGGDFSISGLPGGTYGVNYTTSSQHNVNRGDITIRNGQLLATNIPASGVITIYGKESGS